MSRVLYVLLAVVALAAGVLSFSALRDLAAACGFSARLAWLLPVVIDAGAAAGSLVWLGGAAAEAARRFARSLALVLLGSSVASNALGHGLAAYQARPHWLIVVLVSAVAPAVLGAVVHLAVLAGRVTPSESETARGTVPDPSELLVSDLHRAEGGSGDVVVDWWSDAPAVEEDDLSAGLDRAGELIAAGAGRRRLARELAISEHAARELLAERRNGHPVVSS